MKKINTKMVTLTNALILSSVNMANASDFNTSVIESVTGEIVDTSNFMGADGVAEGTYLVDIKVNNKNIAQQELIKFIKHADEIVPCVGADLLVKYGVDTKYLDSSATYSDGLCLNVKDANSQIQIGFDDSSQILSLTIPQAYFIYDDPSWVPPAQRDVGVNGAFVDYYANYAINKNDGAPDNHSLSANGTVGVNIGQWRARADFQYYDRDVSGNSNAKSSDFKWTQAYVFRDLPSINAKIKIGETYMGSDVFDSVRFQGVSLYSDNNMLPRSLRGYAPEVTGVAMTNAKVTILQGERVIKQVDVPPGPFRIRDLPNGMNGLYTIRIEEENGQVTESQQHATQIPFLSRKGMLRYKAAVGQLAPFNANQDFPDRQFISAEGSYGLTNTTSIYGGVVATVNEDDYQAFSVGTGTSLGALGAISFDITQSYAKQLNRDQKYTGKSYRVSYAKFFESTQSNLSFTGYRFSERNYVSFGRYVDMLRYADGQYGSNEKNLFTLSLSQYLAPINASIGVSATQQTYWDESKNTNYSVNLNKTVASGPLKNLTFSLSGVVSNNRARYQGMHSEKNNVNLYQLSLSYPLDNRRGINYYADYDTDRQEYGSRVSYYGTRKNNQNASYSVSVAANDASFKDPTLSGNYSHLMGAGELNITGNFQKHNQYASASFSGSVTAMRKGLVLHPRVQSNRPRLIVDTGVKNVGFVGNVNRTNRFGLVGFNNIESYRHVEQRVDDNTVADNIEIQDHIVDIAATDGAIGYRKLGTLEGEKLMVQIQLPDGSYPPFGTFIYNEKSQQEHGIVANDGQAYLTGIQEDVPLVAKWRNQSCTLKLKVTKEDYSQMNTVICEK